MAKVRSLRHIKKEIEKVEASIRKNAKGKAVAGAKKRALNYLGKMKAMISDECDPTPPSFSPIPPAAKMTATSTRKTAKKKGAGK